MSKVARFLDSDSQDSEGSGSDVDENDYFSDEIPLTPHYGKRILLVTPSATPSSTKRVKELSGRLGVSNSCPSKSNRINGGKRQASTPSERRQPSTSNGHKKSRLVQTPSTSKKGCAAGRLL